MLRVLLVLVGFWGLALPRAGAQEVQLVFPQKQHDLGQVGESGGKVRQTFTYINQGDSAVKLVSVASSCGCTVPQWSKKPLAPGDTGRLTAVFDPHGRPGPIRKMLTVKTTGKPGTHLLFLKGQVVEQTPQKTEPEAGPAAPAAFRQHFGYNGANPAQRQAAFDRFIQEAAEYIAARPQATIQIIGSASRVPTQSFPDNPALAQHRAESAKKALESALQAEGLEAPNFAPLKSQVAGPPYQNNPSDTSRYRPHQYVEIRVK